MEGYTINSKRQQLEMVAKAFRSFSTQNKLLENLPGHITFTLQVCQIHKCVFPLKQAEYDLFP